MSLEQEAKDALKRIKDLEKEVSALKGLMKSQYDKTEELNRRVGKLERQQNA